MEAQKRCDWHGSWLVALRRTLVAFPPQMLHSCHKTAWICCAVQRTTHNPYYVFAKLLIAQAILTRCRREYWLLSSAQAWGGVLRASL
jgi:hypothetical protein